MKKCENIKESLNILAQLATQIDYLKENWLTLFKNQEYMKQLKLAGYYHNQTFVETTSGIIQNMIIIKANAFLDEYNQEFNVSKFPEYKDQILRIKRICKPIMRVINKWSDIKSYRNEILGHNLRKDGESLFLSKTNYKIPFTNYDHLALCELIFMIADQLKYEFENIMKDLINTNLTNNFSIKQENLLSQNDLEEIKKEVELIRCIT